MFGTGGMASGFGWKFGAVLIICVIWMIPGWIWDGLKCVFNRVRKLGA